MKNSSTTKYAKLNNDEFYTLFSTEKWNSLGFSSRLEACQEAENRYAQAKGSSPCTVTHTWMEGRCYGQQNNQTIYLNTWLLESGEFHSTFTGEDGRIQSMSVSVPAPGWQMLDTIYHEGTHGLQESQGRIPYSYFTAEADYDLYRIQSVEKEAFAAGQYNTLSALDCCEKTSGKLDPERNEYFESVNRESFQKSLANAAQKYNDPEIEKTVNSVIYDRDHGITPEEQSDSYKAVSAVLERSYEKENTQENLPEQENPLESELAQNEASESENNVLSPQEENVISQAEEEQAPALEPEESMSYWDTEESLSEESIGNESAYEEDPYTEAEGTYIIPDYVYDHLESSEQAEESENFQNTESMDDGSDYSQQETNYSDFAPSYSGGWSNYYTSDSAGASYESDSGSSGEENSSSYSMEY